MAERRFDSREVKEILRRAEELQAPSGGGPAHGPTLSQLQEAASELGLSPQLIAAAAAQVASEPMPKSFWSRLWGGSTVVQRTETVAGRLTSEGRLAILNTIREQTGLVGQASTLGEGLEFRHNKEDTGETFHLSIMPDGARSKISVRADYRAAYVCYLVVMFPLVPMFVALSKDPRTFEWPSAAPLVIVLLGLASIACFLSARWFIMRTVRRGRASIDDLLRVLAPEIEQRSVPVPDLAAIPQGNQVSPSMTDSAHA